MFTQNFDARQFEPQQGFDKHPPGIFDAIVSNTDVKPTKNGQGQLFEVEFTTPVGKIINRYNLWNQEPKTVEIALKELSALCYVTGIFVIPQGSKGEVLRNARCKIEVVPGKNKDGTDTGYMEVKRVLDHNGNEPGRAGQAQQPSQAPQQSQQPAQQGGGWGTSTAGNGPTQAAPNVPAGNAGWQPGPTQAPAANPAPGAPPWAR